MNESSTSQAAMRTDLASELDLSDREGILELHEQVSGIDISTIKIVSEGAEKRLGKPRGEYITIDVGKVWLASDEQLEKTAEAVAGKLMSLAEKMCGKRPRRVLVAGLGNRRITADALGSETVDLLTVTRHLREHQELFELFGGTELSAVAPGVLGETGIEAALLVKGAAEAAQPELIIAIDSLAARSTERLATTVQLGTSGISPGSGTGGRRIPINADTAGAPVLAFGIPTIVDSATLVLDALEAAGVDHVSDTLRGVLSNGRDFFVTPKETDMMVRELSRLSARAIGLAFAH